MSQSNLAAIFKQQKMKTKTEEMQAAWTPDFGHGLEESQGPSDGSEGFGCSPETPDREFGSVPYQYDPRVARKYGMTLPSRSPVASPLVVKGINIEPHMDTPAPSQKCILSMDSSASGGTCGMDDVELGDSGYKPVPLTQDSDFPVIPLSLDFASLSPDGKGLETPSKTTCCDDTPDMLATEKKRKASSSAGPFFEDTPEPASKKTKPMVKANLEFEAGNHGREDKSLLRQSVLDHFLRTTLAEPHHFIDNGSSVGN